MKFLGLRGLHELWRGGQSAGAGCGLSAEDIAVLEECCLPHPIVGTTNANPPQEVVLLDEKK